MKITKARLTKIIKEELLKESPEQQAAPDAGTGTAQDAADQLIGILDDWGNNPDMKHPEGDQFRLRIADVIDLLEGLPVYSGKGMRYTPSKAR